MKLRWRDLRESSTGVHLNETIELPNLVKENRQLIACEPFQVDLHGTEESKIGHVEGTLKSKATFRCSRCLTDYSEDLIVPFEEDFVQAEDELAVEDGADEADRIPVLGETIDLVPHLEQTVNLALPYTPLCREECAGLCSECGVNRNETACACKTERIDPRLADLAKFFEQDS
ncbi:MAG TPA: DUF177 domain-containing protein [Bacilli bacterium]|nr:DUF177 domain-containing protein [Bacilli bacterium]